MRWKSSGIWTQRNTGGRSEMILVVLEYSRCGKSARLGTLEGIKPLNLLVSLLKIVYICHVWILWLGLINRIPSAIEVPKP